MHYLMSLVCGMASKIARFNTTEIFFVVIWSRFSMQVIPKRLTSCKRIFSLSCCKKWPKIRSLSWNVIAPTAQNCGDQLLEIIIKTNFYSKAKFLAITCIKTTPFVLWKLRKSKLVSLASKWPPKYTHTSLVKVNNWKSTVCLYIPNGRADTAAALTFRHFQKQK